MKYIRQVIPYLMLSGVLILTGYTFLQINQAVTFFLPDPKKYYDVIFIDPPVYLYALGYLSIILFSFLILERRWKKGIGVLLFILPIIIFYGKTEALLSVFIFFIASLGLGSWFYSYFQKKDKSITDYFFSIYLGLCLNGFMIWGLMHVKVNYTAFYYLFFLSEIILFRKRILHCLGLVFKFIKVGKLSGGQKIIIVSFVFFIFYPLASYYQWDELVNHLYISKYTSLHGIFHFSPEYPAVLDQSIIPKASYTAVYILGRTLGEFAIRFLNYFLLYFTFFLLEHQIRKRYGNMTAFISTLAAISTPFLTAEIGLIFLDPFAFIASAVLFIQLLFTLDDLSGSNIILYFILVPLTYFSKQQSMFIIIPTGLILTCFIIMQIIKTGSLSRLNFLIVGIMLSLLIFLPPMVHNFNLTGNPVFPYSNKLYRSPWFDTNGFLSGMYTKMPAVPALTDKIKLMTWYYFTFNGFDPRYYFWMNKFSFGITYFIFFIFSPLIFLMEKDRKILKELLILYFIFLVSIILWLYILTGPQMRYFITCLPVGSIIIGFTIKIILDGIKNRRLISFAVIPVVTIIFAANFIFQMSSAEYPYPLSGLLTDKNINEKVKYWQDVRQVFDHANTRYGINARGMLSYSPALYFADFNIQVDDWYNYKLSNELSIARNTPELFRFLFKEKKFNFLILTDDSRYRKIFSIPPDDKMLIKEFSRQNYTLYRPNPIYL